MKVKGKVLLILAVMLCLLGKKVYAQGDEIKEVQSPADIPVAVIQEYGSLAKAYEILGKESYKVYLSHGGDATLPIRWDLRAVNTDRVGVYRVTGKMEIPEGYSLKPGVSVPAVYASVSVQKKDMPEINAYYKMSSAGVFVFSWLDRENTDMHGYLKRQGGFWVSLEEYALCERDGLYLSDRAMISGNIYELAVTYGTSMTKILRFLYTEHDTLEILGYRKGTLELGGSNRASTILSWEGEKNLERCRAFAIQPGESLDPILNQLEDFWILGSTSKEFEDTPENPALVLKVKWDTGAVNRKKPGVYKVKGEFQSPEGYRFGDGLKLPEISVYISVQKKEDPQINTYYMPTDNTIFFPVILDGFTEKEKGYIEIYVKKNQGSYRKVREEEGGIRKNDGEEGIEIISSVIFEKGNRYSICMVHPKGSSGIYSFVYNGSFLAKGNMTGRNFSDRDEKNLPAIVQMDEKNNDVQNEEVCKEASAYNEENNRGGNDDDQSEGNGNEVLQQTESRSAETVTEIVTDKTTVLSGKRLALMRKESGDFLVFEKNGMSLFLPSETAAGWGIGEEEELQISIYEIGDTGFAVRIFVRGEEIVEISGAKMEMPLELFDVGGEPEDIKVSDGEGTLCKSSYLSEENRMLVFLNATGDFFLESSSGEAEDTDETGTSEDEEKETETEKTTTQKRREISDREVIFLCLAATGTFIVFWKCKRKKGLFTGKGGGED